MKKVNSILIVSLLILAGCGGGSKSGNIGIVVYEEYTPEIDTFFTVDVRANYPQKELILQDFMDVEYIALETRDGFYCQGSVMAVGKDYIVVRNRVNDGDIYIFDINGKGLRKINRMGRGGEEYFIYFSVTLDEDNGELFVNDLNRQLVYDLYGNFKRSIPKNENNRFNFIHNFDREYFICTWSSYADDKSTNQVLTIMSKQDGSIVEQFPIYFKEKKTTSITAIGGGQGASGPSQLPINRYHDNWIFSALSSDTVFKFSQDYSMTPLIVRTPSIQSMNPEVFLYTGIITDNYYFMKTVKKEYNFQTNSGFPSTHLMYDRKEKTIYEYTVYNDDFSTKSPVDMIQVAMSNEIAFWQKLEADDLFDAYKVGHLKGKLKEIAAILKEEDNPVIMLVKHKR